MQSFTHHNTCVNVVDAITETDPEALKKPLSWEHQNEITDQVVAEARKKSGGREDDNVSNTPIKNVTDRINGDGKDEATLEKEAAPAAAPESVTDAKVWVKQGSKKKFVPTKEGQEPVPVEHPANVKFVPLVLDSYEHLPADLVLD